MRLLKNILTWFAEPENRDKIIVTFFAAIFVAAFWWLLKRIRSLIKTAANRIVWIIRGYTPLEMVIDTYRKTLEVELFQIQHAWMKEGQRLKDILVPVVVQSERISGIEDWSVLLNRYFSFSEKTLHRRLAIIGGPGSGKSVALKAAAHEIWNLTAPGKKDSFIPVVVTFSEYRRAGFDIADACISSLRARAFRLDTEAMEHKFVKASLTSGRLFVIIDGLDELERSDRKLATDHLIVQLRRFPAVSAIFSCRTAAWHNQLTAIGRDVIQMADFTPTAIRQFLKQWDFPPPKTSEELIEAVESQPHIAELARSPLMLTIIAFLYSQPKYHLPQNRAEFYDVCSRALLEEWDQHQNPDRANRFERHHKEYVLSELAFEHLSGPTPDADLDEWPTLQKVAEVMRRYSLKEGENLKLLDEIRENSGLLIRLPPSGLRFPHQTFLEFFAALWLIRQDNRTLVIDLYESDRQRWREVLLLYIGLSTNAEESSLAIARLEKTDSLEMALCAMADARAIKPAVSDGILKKCSDSLEAQSDPKLITLLGYLAANQRTSYSQHAGEILRTLLKSVAETMIPPSPLVLEALLLASLRRPTEETTRFIVDHLNDLHLGRILPQMGERGFVLSTRVISDPSLPHEKKLEWIDGLRRAGGVKPLLQLLMQKGAKPDISTAIAVSLLRLSKSQAFKDEVESFRQSEDLLSDKSIVELWGWPFAQPRNPAAQRLMLYLALKTAEYRGTEAISTDETDVDPRLIFLAFAIGARRLLSIRYVAPDASSTVLRSVWRRMNDRRWLRWMEWYANSTSLTVFATVALPILYVWSVLSFLLTAAGMSSIGLKSSATLAVLVGGFIAGLCLILVTGDVEDFLLGVMLGPAAILWELGVGRAKTWLTYVLVFVGFAALSVYVSNHLVLKISFGLVLTAQFIFAIRISPSRPAHPVIANKETWRLCQWLQHGD